MGPRSGKGWGWEVSFYKKDKTKVTEAGDTECESAAGSASRDHGAKSKTLGVLERGEEPTRTRHPSRQDMDEEGAGDTLSLDKQLVQSLQRLRQAKRNPWVHRNSTSKQADCPPCPWPDLLSGREGDAKTHVFGRVLTEARAVFLSLL